MLVLQNQKADRWAAVRKTHADGGHHWHVIAFWDKGFRARSPRALDVAGVHPNIKKLPRDSDIRRVWDYMHKEEGAVHFGTWEGPIKVDVQKRTQQATWAYIREVSLL